MTMSLCRCLLLLVLIYCGSVLGNELPPELRVNPRLADHDWKMRLTGLIPDREELVKKPRVIFGYLSEKDWAFMEFLCFTHASWRYVTSMAEPTGYRIDIIVFAEQRWLREAASICEVVDLETVQSDGYHQLQQYGNASTCFVVPYPRPFEAVWQNYPYVASYHYLADSRVADLMTSTYGYAMKTDFDCFITATFIHHFPQQFEVGYMHYTPLPGTAERLERVAEELGLKHRGRHDIGPTWYADVRSLITVAQASLPVVHYLLEEEFETESDGSWGQNWAVGEGWPLWCKDMAVMYAPDIVLNHMMEHFDISKKYDVHGDTQRYTFTLYHIHSQHGDGNFSKFEFFKHMYSDRDITTGLDFHHVKDYALWMAVSTWRSVVAMHGPSGGGGGGNLGAAAGG